MKRTTTLMGTMAAMLLGLGIGPGISTASDNPLALTGDPGTLIVGGHNTAEQYSWMASLQRSGQHSCGASLIHRQWVVTAAHCAVGANPADLSLRIGSPDHTSGGTVARVSQIVIHPDYATKNPNGDIALLKLDSPVEQKPIAIADKSGEVGAPSRIIGWGLECPVRGCGEPPAQLKELETQVASDVLCATGGVDGPTEICTGSREMLLANACFGDSGGPQLEGGPGNWRLTGVTSRLGSLAPACGGVPSIYTDATAYKNWIYQTIG